MPVNQTDIQAPNKSSNPLLWIKRNVQKIALTILTLWCFLPVVMSIYDLIMGALGEWPSLDELLSNGAQQGNINYLASIKMYYHLFLALGIATMVFVLLIIILRRPKIFSKKQLQKTPWFYLLFGVLVWATISTLLSPNPLHSFTGGDYVHDGLLSYYIYGGIFLCGSMIHQEKYRLVILRIFGCVVSYLSIIMLIQDSGIPFLDYCFPCKHSVVFNNPNHFGYVLCMGILTFIGLYLYDQKVKSGIRILYAIGFSLLIYTLLLNNTFGSYLASVVSVLVIFIIYKKQGNRIAARELIPAFIFIALSLLNIFNLLPHSNTLLPSITQLGGDLQNIAEGTPAADSAGSGRLALWKATLVRIGERPFFGFGPEGFYGEFSIGSIDRPHNEYLQVAGYLGIPALILYLGALVSLAIHKIKMLKRISPMVTIISIVSFCYLISAFFGNPVFNTVPFFWMFLGMATDNGINEPLVSPSAEDDIKSKTKEKTNKKHIIVIVVIALLLTGVIIVIGSYLKTISEKSKEEADLQCMRSAEATANLLLNNGLISAGSYWFDASSYSLIPSNETMPVPYGLGTPISTSIPESFNKMYSTVFDYDTAIDYQDKIIQVSIDFRSSLNPDDTNITVKWVLAN